MTGMPIAKRVACSALALGMAAIGIAPVAGAAAPGTPAAAALRAPSPGSPGIGDPYFPLYGNGGYDARRYRLDIRYRPLTGRLVGTAVITARSREALESFNLDLVGLRIRSVNVDGAAATWLRRDRHELVVTPARPIAADVRFRTVVRYAGDPGRIDSPILGTYGFLETPDGALVAGQPEAAAFWFPVNDHPRDKARYRIRLTVPRGLQAVSNGLRTSRRVHGPWVTTRWQTQAPMASYLVFAAIGEFEVHRWRTRSGLPVLDAVDSGITGPHRRRIERSLARQGEIVRHLARRFGPYPFETMGGVVDDLDLGFALETQTRPVYSPRFWGFTGEQAAGDGVVVHELAHQWYGDSVSLHRWQDIWLNEGFATYAEWLWQRAENRPTPHQMFEVFYSQHPYEDEFWDFRIGDPGPRAIFDGRVYLRGAMTLQALRETIGAEAFFDVLRTWARQHRNGTGTTAGFVRLSERVSGEELSPLFRAWLYTPHKPPRPEPASGAVAPASVTGEAVRSAARRWQQGLERRLQLQSSSRAH